VNGRDGSVRWGGFWLLAFLPLGNASLQSLWQSKTPADVLGRVFAARRLIAQGSLPISMLIAGPSSDKLAEPAMAALARPQSLGSWRPIDRLTHSPSPSSSVHSRIFASASFPPSYSPSGITR
jgi:hypothetical protein